MLVPVTVTYYSDCRCLCCCNQVPVLPVLSCLLPVPPCLYLRFASLSLLVAASAVSAAVAANARTFNLSGSLTADCDSVMTVRLQQMCISIRRCLRLLLPGVVHAWAVSWPSALDVPGFPDRGDTLWWLQIASLAWLYVLLCRSSGTGRTAFAFCWVWLAVTLWWLYTSMHVYGGLAAWMAVLAVLALSGFLAGWFGLAFALWGRVFGRCFGANPTPVAVVARVGGFAACWVLAELARHHIFTGLPWAAAGYAHITGPLQHAAPWLGVYGVALLAALLAACVGEALLGLQPMRKAHRHRSAVIENSMADRSPLRPAYLPVGLTLAAVVVAVVLMLQSMAAYSERMYAAAEADNTAPHVSVRLLQGNIPQGEKFDMDTGVPQALQWYMQQWQTSTATLTVAPETAIPLLPYELPDGYLPALGARFGAGGSQAALLGIPLGDFERGYTNSVIGIAPAGAQSVSDTEATEAEEREDFEKTDERRRVYVYSKHHLVPFGEFIPRHFRWFTEMMNIPLGDFDRGERVQPDFFWQGNYWMPNICYEDVFGDELAARFVSRPNRPAVLVNVSNIAWFGDSSAVDQHLNMSRMRALELARPMLRATNTGATAIINGRGQVVKRLDNFAVGVLDGRLRGTTWHTPYARWAGQWGHTPLLLFVLLLLALCAVSRNGWRYSR